MSARLWELWRQWSGVAMAERTAYTKGYDEGFKNGLAVSTATDHAKHFIDGFKEGRESTRTIPLDSSFADEEESWPSH